MPHPNKAFKVVQASAGSGKTYTIIKEYLKLCLKSEVTVGNYSQILAITFTNMAANEMKAKIVRQLLKIANSDPGKEAKGMESDLIKELGISREELKAHAQLLFTKILHNYSDFFICTIDAFVQKLARSFAKDLGLPSQFNVSLDDEEVADDITERIGEQIGETHPHLTHIVTDFTESRMEDERKPKVSREIHDFTQKLFTEETLGEHEGGTFMEQPKYEETRKFIDGKIRPFEARCQRFVKEFSEFIGENGLEPEHFSGKSRSACLSILKKLQQKDYATPTATLLKILDGETNWYSKELSEARASQLQPAFEQVFMDPVKWYVKNVGAYHFYKAQHHQLSLYVLRSKLKEEMEAYIGEEQVVHISEFNKRINRIMGDFSVPFIYERLGNRFKHVFIDEFQDTSVMQWQNLIPLLHNGISAGHMSMVVGDGKQSIYRWRNGEVGQIASLPLIYAKPDDSPAFDEFERNFINNFNFSRLDCNYRSFRNIIQFNNEFFEASLPYLSPEAQKVYFDQENAFGKQVIIKQEAAHQEPGYVGIELFEPKADEAMLQRIGELIDELVGLGFTKSDITILVRKNKTGSMIAEFLAKRGIPVVSADSILLKSSGKVRLIVGALDYLIHPDNPVTAATLNYYWNLLQCERFDGTADGFFEHGPDTEALQALLLRSYSLYDLCSALMRHFGFDPIGDTYLSYLLDVVYQWQSADEAGIADFLEYWEKKKNKLTVAAGNTDAVNVMTIHKSKGLEFKAVICPFVEDNLDDTKPSTFWTTPHALGFEDIPNIDEVQFTLNQKSASWSPEIQQLADKENAQKRLDHMNLNYVAFTRAVQRLHILAFQTKNAEKSPINAFVATGHDHYGDHDTPKVVEEDREDDDPVMEFYHPSQSGDWLNKIHIDGNPSIFWAHPEDKMKPQEWGDFVHQVLSEIKSDRDIDRALRPHLDSGVIDQATADMLKNLFLQTVTHPVIEKAFSADAKVKNECDILLSNGAILRPDRYAELPDKVILLDYKTGQKSKDHHRQLRSYMDVVGRMVSKPIEGYLVYLGDTVEVERV